MSKYSAQDIEVLEGLDPVRKRPGMYIAGTDTPAGLHQLASEIIDNSVDEAMNGYASQISVILHQDGQSVTVEDNGRGIPVDKHPKFKKSALELILTTLHAGGKFSANNYQSSGGLHGVGSSVVNALSDQMIATVYRDGKIYQQEYSRGKPTTKVTSKNQSGRKKRGTVIFFKPDSTIFKKIDFNPETLKNIVQTKAFLNPGLKINWIDEVSSKNEEFCYEDGLKAYLDYYLKDNKLKPIGDKIFSLSQDEEIYISCSFCWSASSTTEKYKSYANGIFTPDGGSHEDGFKSGVVKVIKNYINIHDLQPKGVKIGAEDIREGLVCILSVKLPSAKYQAQFQGQTKDKLNNPQITPIVESLVRTFENELHSNQTIANQIVQRIVLAAKARAASRAASKSVRRKLGVHHRLNLPGKLADCSSNKTEQTELFVVEGDSAGGSAKQGRSREFQAILPLRGKILNSIAAPAKKVFANTEIENIISALGAGVGKDFNPDKLRYGKLIILTDADADGMHIATLLIAFFFKYMPGLIDHGSLYIGNPPLYRIRASNSAKAKVHWAYSEDEKERIIAKNKMESPEITRFKGLGEMNPETLWKTTLDPKTRTIYRVKTEDYKEAQDYFQALMGSDSSKRLELITQGNSEIKLDI